MARSSVEIRLLAEPLRFSMAERVRFRVGLTGTNVTGAAIDPQLHAARLLVNGEPSVAFDLALGNSVTPAGWDRLGPGETSPAIAWPLGEALFVAPGEYELVLRLDAPEQPPIAVSQTVVVTP